MDSVTWGMGSSGKGLGARWGRAADLGHCTDSHPALQLCEISPNLLLLAQCPATSS